MSRPDFIEIDAETLDDFAEALRRLREDQIDKLYFDLFGDLRAFKRQPANPERAKALTRLRDLKRLRDGTTYAGERDNAQAAMDRLMAKHGITESEI